MNRILLISICATALLIDSSVSSGSIISMAPEDFDNPYEVSTGFNTPVDWIPYGAGDKRIDLRGSSPKTPNSNSNNLYGGAGCFTMATGDGFDLSFDFRGVSSENVYAFGLIVQPYYFTIDVNLAMVAFDQAGTTELGRVAFTGTSTNIYFMGIGSTTDSIGLVTLAAHRTEGGRVDARMDRVLVQSTVAVPEPTSLSLLNLGGLLGLAFYGRLRRRRV